MSQSGALGSDFEALLPSQRQLLIKQEPKPFGMVEGPSLGLGVQVLEAPRHARQAQLVEKIECWMVQHWRFPVQWKDFGPRTLA